MQISGFNHNSPREKSLENIVYSNTVKGILV
jgi:hypothetical protein